MGFWVHLWNFFGEVITWACLSNCFYKNTLCGFFCQLLQDKHVRIDWNRNSVFVPNYFGNIMIMEFDCPKAFPTNMKVIFLPCPPCVDDFSLPPPEFRLLTESPIYLKEIKTIKNKKNLKIQWNKNNLSERFLRSKCGSSSKPS